MFWHCYGLMMCQDERVSTMVCVCHYISLYTIQLAPEPSTTNNCWPSRAQKKSPESRDSTSEWAESEKTPHFCGKNPPQNTAGPPCEELVEVMSRFPVRTARAPRSRGKCVEFVQKLVHSGQRRHQTHARLKFCGSAPQNAGESCPGRKPR